MKIIRSLILLILLSSCGFNSSMGLAPAHTSPDLSPAQQAIKTIQDTLNNGRQLLIAAQLDINSNIENRLITHKQAQEEMDDIGRYKKSIADAQTLLDAGDIANAKTQADIYHAAILQLQKRVAAAKSKGVSP